MLNYIKELIQVQCSIFSLGREQVNSATSAAKINIYKKLVFITLFFSAQER